MAGPALHGGSCTWHYWIAHTSSGMVGALVLVALAVIFLPMLFSRQDEQRQVVVEAPAAPQAPVVPQVQVEPVVVPEPQALPQEPVPTDEDVAAQEAPSMPVQPSVPVVKPTPAPVVAAKPAAPAPVPKPVAPQPAAPGKPDVGQSRIDPNGLPISWSIQLASLANRESADALQKSCEPRVITLISAAPTARTGCLSGR